MNHYMMIRGLRRPAILLLIGGVWLLHSIGIISHPWHWFVPLLLIMLGTMMLAERAAMAAGGPFPPYSGTPQPGAPNYQPPSNIPSYPGQPTAYVPPQHQDPEKDSEGGNQ
ncbi:MAG: hypothetical protein ABSF70_08835 [Terracidiphilus sp.]